MYANGELNEELQKCVSRFIFPKGTKAIRQKGSLRRRMRDVYFFMFPVLLRGKGSG